MSILAGECLDAALVALSEDRLWFRVCNRYRRPCNGGNKSFSHEPAIGDKPGSWTTKIDNPKMCSRGYHVTKDPLKWSGEFVCLVEVDQVVDVDNDKAVCGSFRELGLVDPEKCIDPRVYVACLRSDLSSADLRGADLCDAGLRGADLIGANLSYADLGGADLRDTDLRGADLSGADLIGANLIDADLRGADLCGADLRGAITKEDAERRGAIV